MRRVVVLGPGGSGKSTFARALGATTGLPVIELDARFWSPALEPTPPGAWRRLQADLAAADAWIMDGDLGPYDMLDERLRRADTVVVLDLARWRCVVRSLRRSWGRADYWRWVLTWRRRSRPLVLRAVAEQAPGAALHVARSPREADRLLTDLGGSTPGRPAF
jgi:adenylate kinase family enzyme